jgi:hypothetical protein
MAGFTKIKDIVDSQVVNGSTRFYTWRKSPTQTTPAGLWFDLSMSPGNPVPKYWFDATPLTAVQVKQSTDGGMYHGANVTPSQKYLRELMAMTVTATALPMPMMLLDYLMYYPTIDDSITDVQTMTNGVTLPRYTTGAGVQMIAVSDATRTGGQTFTVSYTNSDGTAGRTTPNVLQSGSSVNGNLLNSSLSNTVGAASGAFIQLQAGDTGVRSVESVTMNGADVGLFTIILVKPIAQFSIRGIDAPVEVDYFKDFPVIPQIFDDAYLNLICLPQGSLAATAIHGTIKTTFY